jgi:hypothetical protein
LQEARKRFNFTEEEIVDFQDLVDELFELWIDIKHRYGLGNYFHLKSRVNLVEVVGLMPAV